MVSLKNFYDCLETIQADKSFLMRAYLMLTRVVCIAIVQSKIPNIITGKSKKYIGIMTSPEKRSVIVYGSYEPRRSNQEKVLQEKHISRD